MDTKGISSILGQIKSKRLSEQQDALGEVFNRNDKAFGRTQDFTIDIVSASEDFEEEIDEKGIKGQLESAMGKTKATYEVRIPSSMEQWMILLQMVMEVSVVFITYMDNG